ncbi:MAG: glutamine synthetase [Anaerolineales bacterium]|nr:glutamine synthetase [Anaerolineales bacterium]
MTENSNTAIQKFKENGVRLVACTLVDNAGVTRVKCVPIDRLASAAQFGIGLSTVFAVFAVDDHITASPGYDTPSGDMRLIPDLAAMVELSGAPGWAWAPVDQYDQDLNVMPICQRSLLKRLVDTAAAQGITFKTAFEIEFTLLTANDEPVHDGPGYSPIALLPLEGFAVEVVTTLEEQGIQVAQFHPEYSMGQVEMSFGALGPVAAADQHVLARTTIRRVAARHGFKTAFAPLVLEGAVGNGCHLHFSAWQAGQNLITNGDGPEGLTPTGEALAAGVLTHLRDLVAVYAPSVLSYSRLLPDHWSGGFTCWGHENREAAIRLIKGTAGSRDRAANMELKTIDHTANPYLAMAMLLGSALDGLERGLNLPQPLQINPSSLSEAEREANQVYRLPVDLGQAIDRLAQSDFARQTMGDAQFEAFLASRQLEWDSYGQMDQAQLTETLRWRYG